MAHEFESQSFEPEEQVEIIRLAARLQAEHAERMTGRDLEVLAEEVGISPRFVRAAAERLGKKKTPARQSPELTPGGVHFMSVVFSLSQIVVVYNLMIHLWGSPTALNSPATLLAVSTALMLGVSRARLKEGTGRLAKRMIGKSVFYAVLCGLFVRLSFGQVDANWWPTFPMLLLVQITVAALGYSLGSHSREAMRQTAQAETR